MAGQGQSLLWLWGAFCSVSIFHNQKMHFYLISKLGLSLRLRILKSDIKALLDFSNEFFGGE